MVEFHRVFLGLTRLQQNKGSQKQDNCTYQGGVNTPTEGKHAGRN